MHPTQRTRTTLIPHRGRHCPTARERQIESQPSSNSNLDRLQSSLRKAVAVDRQGTHESLHEGTLPLMRKRHINNNRDVCNQAMMS